MAKFVHIKRILDSVLTQEEFSISLTFKTPENIEKTYLEKKEIAKLLSEKEAHAEDAILRLSRKLDDNTTEKVSYFEKECDRQSPSLVLEYEIERRTGEIFWAVNRSSLSMNKINLKFNEEIGSVENVSWNADFPNLPIIWSYSAGGKFLVMSPKVFKGFLQQYTGFDNHQDLFLAVLNLKDIKEIRDLLASLTKMSKIIPGYAKLRTKNKTEKALRCLLGQAIEIELRYFLKYPERFPEKKVRDTDERYTLLFSFPKTHLTINTVDNTSSWEIDEKGIKRRGNTEKEVDQILASFHEEFLKDFLKTLKEKVNQVLQNQAYLNQARR